MDRIVNVEKIIGYTFKDKKHLKVALTHSSYSNEHRCESNERYEFLGDSVLGMVVAQNLFLTVKAKEGDYTKMRAELVSEKSLAFLVDELGLEEYLLKGKGESKVPASKAVKCDLYEAIVGAIFLDGGLNHASKFILSTLGQAINNFKSAGTPIDNKSKLQEVCKKEKVKYTYKKKGQSNAPIFVASVHVNGVCMGTGTADNKRSAEMIAAGEALKKLTKV